MQSIPVYQSDKFGFLLYTEQAYELALHPGAFNIPYGAIEAAPPVIAEGYVARLNAAGNGWVAVEDHRRDALYYVRDPAANEKPAVVVLYQLGDPIEVDGQIVSYDGGGPVPAWLTATPPEPASPV